jgi:hypothetical protein
LIDANPKDRSVRDNNRIPAFLRNIRWLSILRRVRLAVRRTTIGWVRTSLLLRVLAGLRSSIRWRRVLALLWRSTTLRRARGAGIVLSLRILSLGRRKCSVGLKIRVRSSQV